MVTQNGQQPEQVNLTELLGKGGTAAAVAFHLISIDFHVSIVASSDDEEDKVMLYDLLLNHLSQLHVSLQRESGPELEVPSQKLIVPGR